jgi:hypothetical protein
MPGQIPRPTLLYRLVHIDNLPMLLQRGALHAPNFTPDDGLPPYHTIHDANVQASRREKQVPCGPGGVIHDYLSFYFGPLSVMLLKLKTGQVPGYSQGQESLVYLVTTVERVAASGARFVFSDGHGLNRLTRWFDDLNQLDAVDWEIVAAQYWQNTDHDGDRQRRKQAEFLVWRSLDWTRIGGIGVLNESAKTKAEAILDQFPQRSHPPVNVKSGWYYRECGP